MKVLTLVLAICMLSIIGCHNPAEQPNVAEQPTPKPTPPEVYIPAYQKTPIPSSITYGIATPDPNPPPWLNPTPTPIPISTPTPIPTQQQSASYIGAVAYLDGDYATALDLLWPIATDARDPDAGYAAFWIGEMY